MSWGNEITFIVLFVLCIGGIGERNSRKHNIFASSTSHALRHSGKRHMLAHVEGGTEANASSPEHSIRIQQVVSSLLTNLSSTSTAAGLTAADQGSSDTCHTSGPCESLVGNCIRCTYNYSCVYGEDTNIPCDVVKFAKCQGNQSFLKTHNCRYCYQTPSHEHTCQRNTSCHVVSAPRQRYVTKCTVKPHVLCLGNRNFAKQVPCNWTKGYSWGTALLLSIVFGGFGVDRFYLGMWQEGIGKLFSFGGLGVWTIVDVVLIATGYLGPADHSLYIRN